MSVRVQISQLCGERSTTAEEQKRRQREGEEGEGWKGKTMRGVVKIARKEKQTWRRYGGRRTRREIREMTPVMERLTEASSQRILIWADREDGRVEGREGEGVEKRKVKVSQSVHELISHVHIHCLYSCNNFPSILRSHVSVNNAIWLHTAEQGNSKHRPNKRCKRLDEQTAE